MIASLQPYPAYKDSGIPWLDNVPEHWEERKLGTLGVFLKGRGISKADITEVGLPALTYGDIYTRFGVEVKVLSRYTSPEVAADAQQILKGDLLFTASGEAIEEIGKTVLYSGDVPGYAGGDVIILRLKKGGGLFISYSLNSSLGIQQKSAFGRGDIIVHISAAKLKRVIVPVPTPDEQSAIARFLDYVDRRVQRHVRAKRRLIELLNEQKQAIIQRAVTRGLDPGVGLKPSGVDWLGVIPEHWDVRRSKRLFTPSKELARPNDIQLSATQSYGVIPQEEYERHVGRKVTKVFLHLEKRRHVELGDFVISMRSFQGGLERAWATGCIRSSYVVLHPTVTVDADFFTYLFKSNGYIKALQSTANFIRDGQDLNLYNFHAVDLPLPPIEEQQQIAGGVRTAIANIARTAERAAAEIALLNEYRTRLIADVVTGKLDVREAAAALPDEVNEELDDASDGAEADEALDEELEMVAEEVEA